MKLKLCNENESPREYEIFSCVQLDFIYVTDLHERTITSVLLCVKILLRLSVHVRVVRYVMYDKLDSLDMAKRTK